MLKRDKSGPRAPYFLGLQEALRNAGIARPVLVVDRKRLMRNLDRITADLAPQVALRLVAKSLPLPELLQLASSTLATQRFMTFNQPMLDQIAKIFPKGDQLLGKPLPVAAAALYGAKGSVHWLIDTKQRLSEYAALTEARSKEMSVVLEVDIGLRRGGFSTDNDLVEALKFILSRPFLRLSGIMGYDAHVPSTPRAFGWRAREADAGDASYDRALQIIREVTGIKAEDLPIRNSGGSKSFMNHRDPKRVNEVSVGTAIVKPSDFDADTLAEYEPALFIATPALKVAPFRTPVLGVLDGIKLAFNPNRANGVFTHGGYWKAAPIDPPGLEPDATVGHSSNQDLWVAGPKLALQPDDFVFLRPTQSEAVMLQFGPVIVVENGAVVDEWETFPVSA